MSNSLHLDIPAGVPWIDFTREFDAPVAAVFEAHRDPEKVKQWLGPHGYEMVIDEWDFTTGGGYPLDQTFHQATKGLVAAHGLLRPGGTMLLVADCGEGLGGAAFGAASTTA